MKKGRRPVTLAMFAAGAAAVSLCHCSKAVEQGTEIVLTVTGNVAGIVKVSLIARNRDYFAVGPGEPCAGEVKCIDEITIDLIEPGSTEPRDISPGADPLTLLLKPSPPIADENDEFGFLVIARGMDSANAVKAAKARILRFVPNTRLEETLDMDADTAAYDVDQDGFVDCRGPLTVEAGQECDCVDNNDEVNPFRTEECGDEIDNNCSGWPPDDGGCPCTGPQICTTLPEEQFSLAGIGQCTFGELACIDGVLSDVCVGAGSPDDHETSGDFIDNDCDGDVDEGGSCTPGDERYCLLGQVDTRGTDCARGEETPDCAASALARGTCVRGLQACTGGSWGDCVGETLPNRPLGAVAWGEGIDGSDQQCDGLDNDCDGFYDEERNHDNDDDGYTHCGTCRSDLCGEIPFCCAPPTDGATAWLADGAVDCRDGVAWINPGMAEDCRLRDSDGGYPGSAGGDAAYYDEDCRCDHDDESTLGVDELGMPVSILGGGFNCAPAQANLDCSVDRRRDPTPIGICEDTQLDSLRYYAGFQPDEITGDCAYCSKPYGDACSGATGSCETKHEACGFSCSDVGSLAEGRPMCCIGDSATDDTPTVVTCAQDAAGNPVAPDWICESRHDYNSECDPLTCNDENTSLAPPGPFFFGIEPDGSNYDRCYYFADVEGLCLDRDQCWTRVAECVASGQGQEADGPFMRPACRVPSGGCSGEIPPIYALNVPAGEDHYGDCTAKGTTCAGNGFCYQSQGESCVAATEICDPALFCVDGVCCNEPCDRCNGGSCDVTPGECWSCIETRTGQPDGTCAPVASQVTDRADWTSSSSDVTCGGATGCANPATGCICEPDTHLCLHDNGTPCTSDDDCASNQCECANNTCSAKVCSAVECPECNFNVNGDNDCEGDVADGSDDAEDNCGALSCNGLGACNLDNGAPCLTNQVCETNQCECSNADCDTANKKCSAMDCDCRYNADGLNDCEASIADSMDDADNTCGSLTCNGLGACNFANGVSCSSNQVCESNQCECSGVTCDPATRKCSNVDCGTCEFNSDGTAGCEGDIGDAYDDADDTCGAQTCNGQTPSVCHFAPNVACTANAHCESNECECSNAICSAKLCSSVDCGECRFNSNGDSTCEGIIADGFDNANDQCTGISPLGDTCNSSGVCHAANGELCMINDDCESDQCECSQADCAQRRCSGVDCPLCKYNANGDSTCEGVVANNVDDADNSCGSLTCSGLSPGVCHLTNGVACTADNQCESDQCECADANCGTKLCSQEDCTVCRYTTDGIGACDGNIAVGYDNADDECPVNVVTDKQTCDGAGDCSLAEGVPCNSNGECDPAQCECSDANCVGKKCSAVDCGECRFNSDGNADCEGIIANGVDDADDTCGSLTCSGLSPGVCHLGNTASCTADAQCELNECECTNATCSAKACSNGDCNVCRYDADSNGVCEGTIAAGYDNADNECNWTGGVGDTCNSSGVCRLDNGQPCTLNDQCETGECECRTGTCLNKVCSEQDCLTCRFTSDGIGACDSNIADNFDNADGDCTGVGPVGDTCNGLGVCHRANGQACSVDNDCQSDQCECQNATCGNKVCSEFDCPICRYTSDGIGVCDGNIAGGSDNADNDCPAVVGDAQMCDGNGACRKLDGRSCTTNNQCASLQCECSNATCTTFLCSTEDCAECEFNPDGLGTCDDTIAKGFDNADGDCTGVSPLGDTCNELGVCHRAAGVGCADDYECESNECECSQNTCAPATKKCSAQDCPVCRYNADGLGPCTEIVAHGYDNADYECTGVSPLGDTCNDSGQCHLANGVLCSANAQCQSNECECGDNTCSAPAMKCSQVDCNACEYNANGDNSCEGMIANGYDNADSECPVCQACAFGSCGAYNNGGQETGCNAGDDFCCGGSCIDVDGVYGGLGCGSGNCAGQSLGCPGGAVECGNTARPCATCVGDTSRNGTCSAGSPAGTLCGNFTDTSCPECQKCTDNGTTSTCDNRNGEDDVTLPNDGCGLCEICSGGTCVADNNGGQEAGCNTGDDFCCGRSCIDIDGVYGGLACGADDCASNLVCPSGTVVCGDTTRACANCVGDTRRVGTCSVGAPAGTSCGNFSTTEDCSLCFACLDSGTTASCVARVLEDDTTAPYADCDVCEICSGGACVPDTDLEGLPDLDYAGICDGGTDFCCGASCYSTATTCGSGFCAGNFDRGCTGGVPDCSTKGSACGGLCALDTRTNGTCKVDGSGCTLGAPTECPTCQTCQLVAPTASCVNSTSGLPDTNGVNTCNADGNTVCCSGVCQNPAGTGSACGDVASFCDTGTWQCSGSNIICGPLDRQCDVCSGANVDVIVHGTCANNDGGGGPAGTHCRTDSSEECNACLSCPSSGYSRSCIAKFPTTPCSYDTDGTAPNQCVAPSSCRADGICAKDSGELCGGAGECCGNSCSGTCD